MKSCRRRRRRCVIVVESELRVRVSQTDERREVGGRSVGWQGLQKVEGWIEGGGNDWGQQWAGGSHAERWTIWDGEKRQQTRTILEGREARNAPGAAQTTPRWIEESLSKLFENDHQPVICRRRKSRTVSVCYKLWLSWTRKEII